MLKKMLHSLSRKRIAVLLADTKEGVKPETEFTVNTNFKSQLTKVIVPVPVEKETFERKKVEIDRTIAIEAAIVKILKARKTMTHLELVNQVLTIL